MSQEEPRDSNSLQQPNPVLEPRSENVADQTAQSGSTAEAPPLLPAAESLAPVQPPGVCLDSLLGVAEALSEGENAELRACEAIIAGGWQAFVEVGLALGRIRDARLYRVEYDNFEAYCKAKCEYGRNYVDRLISAAQVFRRLMTICHQTPQHESQVRPLIGLKPEEAQLAWTCAVESAGGRKITARLVKRAIQDLGLAAPPKPVSKINRNAKAERRKLINDTIGQLLLLIGQKAAYETILHPCESRRWV